MRIECEPGFVLHRRPFGESSVTLELWTQRLGRVGALAKGARQRKKTGASLALSYGSEFVFQLAGNGELLQLRQFELSALPAPLSGPLSLAVMYVNELIVCLIPRGDAHPRLFEHYRQWLRSLSLTALAIELRRFERALVEELGYAPDFSCDADGQAISAGACYRVDPEAGFFLTSADALGAVPGGAILAFDQAEPPPELLAPMRVIMRKLIQPQLHGKTLVSWGLMHELSQRATASPVSDR